MDEYLFKTFLKKIRNRKVEKMYENYLNNPSWAKQFKKQYFPPDNLIENKQILDFGCGRGRHVALFSQLKGKVVGMDVKPNEFWRKIPNANFLLGSDRELSCIKDETFDIFLAIQVVMYIEDDKRILREIFRILKDNGCLLMQVTNKKNLYTLLWGKSILPEIDIKRYYSVDDIIDLMEDCGFVIERVWMEKFYAPLFPIPINYILEILLPSWTEKMVSRITPSRYRGLINVVARKTEVS